MRLFTMKKQRFLSLLLILSYIVFVNGDACGGLEKNEEESKEVTEKQKKTTYKVVDADTEDKVTAGTAIYLWKGVNAINGIVGTEDVPDDRNAIDGRCALDSSDIEPTLLSRIATKTPLTHRAFISSNNAPRGEGANVAAGSGQRILDVPPDSKKNLTVYALAPDADTDGEATTAVAINAALANKDKAVIIASSYTDNAEGLFNKPWQNNLEILDIPIFPLLAAMNNNEDVAPFWSSTSPEGRFSGLQSCNNWSSGDNADLGIYGNSIGEASEGSDNFGDRIRNVLSCNNVVAPALICVSFPSS